VRVAADAVATKGSDAAAVEEPGDVDCASSALTPASRASNKALNSFACLLTSPAVWRNAMTSMLSCIAGSESPPSTMLRLWVMVRRCSRMRSARQLGNVGVSGALDKASSTAEGASNVRTLSTSRAASWRVPRSLGRSQVNGTLTPPGAGEAKGRGGTTNAPGRGTGRGMVGWPGRNGLFAVKSYVTDQREPCGPATSCRTVRPFGAGMPPNAGIMPGAGGGGGAWAGAPSAGAGCGAAASPGCTGVPGAGVPRTRVTTR
jgi:hypothetical protein